MSILTRCDGGCGAEVALVGPNTGAVPIPSDWVQLSIERKMQTTLIQHQCPRCFADATKRAQQAAQERALPATDPTCGNYDAGITCKMPVCKIHRPRKAL